MDLIDTIVQINITRQTNVPSVRSFSEILLVDQFDPSTITVPFSATNRVNVFTSLSSIASAGFATTSYIYKAASRVFSQSPSINRVYVGMKLATDAGWTVAMNAIRQSNNEWYAIVTSARLMINQQQIAEFAEANKKLYVASSGDPVMVTEDTGDIASWGKAASLDRTVVIYHPQAILLDDELDIINPNDPIIEAGWLGVMLPIQPGSANWKFQTISGVPVYSINEQQQAKLDAKSANWYQTVAGIPITSEGVVLSGEFVDIIHGLDWFHAIAQQSIFTVLVLNDKVDYTDEGVQIIISALRDALSRAVSIRLFASFEIEELLVADVPIADKGNRILPDIRWSAVLSGAINKTIANGTVTL